MSEIKSGNLYKCKLDLADTKYIYILKEAISSFYLVIDMRDDENKLSAFSVKEIKRDFELVE